MAQLEIPKSQKEQRKKYRKWRKENVEDSAWKSVPTAIAEMVIGEPFSDDPAQMTGLFPTPIAYANSKLFREAIEEMIRTGNAGGVDENILQGLAGLHRALKEGRISDKTIQTVKKIDYAPHLDPATIGDSGPVRYGLSGESIVGATPAQKQVWLGGMEQKRRGLLSPAGFAEGMDQYVNINPHPDLSSQYNPGDISRNVEHIAPKGSTWITWPGSGLRFGSTNWRDGRDDYCFS